MSRRNVPAGPAAVVTLTAVPGLAGAAGTSPAATGTKDKELFPIPGATHIQTCFVPEYVDKAGARLRDCLGRALKRRQPHLVSAPDPLPLTGGGSSAVPRLQGQKKRPAAVQSQV